MVSLHREPILINTFFLASTLTVKMIIISTKKSETNCFILIIMSSCNSPSFIFSSNDFTVKQKYVYSCIFLEPHLYVCTRHYPIIIIMHTYLKILNYGNACTFCLACVSKIKSGLSIIFYAIYGAVRIQPNHFRMMVVRIRVLCLIIIMKSEVWPICHCLGLRRETIVCAVYIFIFLRLGLGHAFVHIIWHIHPCMPRGHEFWLYVITFICWDGGHRSRRSNS